MLAPKYLGAELLGSEFSLPVDQEFWILVPCPYPAHPCPLCSLFLKNNSVCLFIFDCAGLCCYTGFSLVVASRGSSLVAVLRLFTAVTSLVSEHGL